MKENPIWFPFLRTRASEVSGGHSFSGVAGLFTSGVPCKFPSQHARALIPSAVNFTCPLDEKYSYRTRPGQLWTVWLWSKMSQVSMKCPSSCRRRCLKSWTSHTYHVWRMTQPPRTLGLGLGSSPSRNFWFTWGNGEPSFGFSWPIFP